MIMNSFIAARNKGLREDKSVQGFSRTVIAGFVDAAGWARHFQPSILIGSHVRMLTRSCTY